MALTQSYVRFLANPSDSALASDAALNYIPTLKTFSNAAPIIQHLKTQEKRLHRKSEKVLNKIEGDHAISLEVETTLEFVSSGGAYLPNLDENFVTDLTVTIPIVRIVFNSTYAHTNKC